jgi:hypothetical protein
MKDTVRRAKVVKRRQGLDLIEVAGIAALIVYVFFYSTPN